MPSKKGPSWPAIFITVMLAAGVAAPAASTVTGDKTPLRSPAVCITVTYQP